MSMHDRGKCLSHASMQYTHYCSINHDSRTIKMPSRREMAPDSSSDTTKATTELLLCSKTVVRIPIMTLVKGLAYTGWCSLQVRFSAPKCGQLVQFHRRPFLLSYLIFKERPCRTARHDLGRVAHEMQCKVKGIETGQERHGTARKAQPFARRVQTAREPHVVPRDGLFFNVEHASRHVQTLNGVQDEIGLSKVCTILFAVQVHSAAAALIGVYFTARPGSCWPRDWCLFGRACGGLWSRFGGQRRRREGRSQRLRSRSLAGHQ
jgi:hypothetical protein